MEASQPEVETSTQTVFNTTAPANEKVSPDSSETPQEQQTMDLSDVEVTNENIALNVLVGMVNIAQKRGAFSLEESSKAWECVQVFMKPQQSQ